MLSCQKVLPDVRDRCVGIDYRLSERVPIAIADWSWLDDESVLGLGVTQGLCMLSDILRFSRGWVAVAKAVKAQSGKWSV